MVTVEKRISMAVDAILASNGSENVEFIYLYGSTALGKAHPGSDLDICIYYSAGHKKAVNFMLNLFNRIDDEIFDIKLFQQLPLYIQIEVFKGKLLYAREPSVVYDVAYKTIKEFESFEPRFYDYIGKEALN